MKRKAISLIVFIACCITIFSFPVNAEEVISPNYTHTDDDYVAIPDKYNTGIEPGVELISFEEGTTVQATVLSDDGGAIPMIQYRTDVDYNNINYYQNKNLASESVIEGYDFSEKRLITINDGLYEESKTIIFKNCKFNKFTAGYSNLHLVFENCTFTGTIIGGNITLNKCYVSTECADGLQPIANVEVKNSLFANLLPMSSQSGAHVDGVQIFGREDFDAENIHFNNVRFSMPEFYYDGLNKTYANAAIMLSLEKSDANNISFENIIIDMGSRHYPIYNVDSSFNEDNITFKNIRITDVYNRIFYPASYNENAVVDNVDFDSKLYVTSIWKDENNKTHIICTNNSKTARTLKVVTDVGEYSFDMDRSPTQTELLNDVAYQSYTYEDMPYDVELIIEENVEYVVCYDTDTSSQNQIRYMNYNETSLPERPDGNIRFEATISSYFEIAIPDSFAIKDLENELKFTASGDIPGNKKLSVTVDETCIMKNKQDEELEASLAVEKDKFIYSDLLNGVESSILISVNKLPAGRYSGYMPVYVKIIDINEGNS